MANYFVLQTNDESAAYAFKVSFDGFKPQPSKNQREQFTVTGALDVQGGPNENMWVYTVKLVGDASGSFAVTPGAIMTADVVTWGDYDDLKTLFAYVVPPNNKLRFRDVDGAEYYAYFTGPMKPKLFAPPPTGPGAYLEAVITLRGSLT